MKKSICLAIAAIFANFLATGQIAVAQDTRQRANTPPPPFTSDMIVKNLDLALYGAFSDAGSACYRTPARLTTEDIILGTTQADIDRANQEDARKCAEKYVLPNAVIVDSNTIKCNGSEYAKYCNFRINELDLTYKASGKKSEFKVDLDKVSYYHTLRSRARNCLIYFGVTKSIFSKVGYEWSVLGVESTRFGSYFGNGWKLPSGYVSPSWSKSTSVYCS